MQLRSVCRPRIVLALLVLLIGARGVSAATIAVFGNNNTDDLLNANGHTALLVTDAQLATPGFLNGFDAFYYTRNNADLPGTSLSAAAAAQVAAWASGNVILLNGDFADSLPGDANIKQLTLNSVAFAAASGHGYIGEFTGAVAGLSANANSLAALSLISGMAGPLGFANGGSNLSLVLDPNGAGHPLFTGVALPYNPAAMEFGAAISGVDPAYVLARWGSLTGDPAIIVRNAVPEPATLLLFGLGVLALTSRRRR